MKSNRNFLRLVLALALASSNSIAPAVFAAPHSSAPAVAAKTADDFGARIARMEAAFEAKRKEMHIPGASLVIVKDDKIVYMKGLGVKDFEKQIPVTPDTLFAIGSSTKAFTAMAAAMSADEGKMSLDDSPKKFLPYFKLQDPEAGAKITIRDLMCHDSGINRTDLAMVSGKLSREELIKVVGLAKPTAKFREKFQYQNIMFAAAGEATARANNSTWDAVIAERIFKPLGMKESNTTVAATQKSNDFALGYDYNSDTNVTRHLPMRSIEEAAPAGAINSNARDMAQWLRLMLNGGVYDGKRLVSEKNFAELIKPQMKISPKMSYGLGWFLREWQGKKLVEHGGNIDGFSTEVALLPDEKIGFALMVNQNDSTLPPLSPELIFDYLIGDAGAKKDANFVAANAKPVSVDEMKREAGVYRLAEANVDFDIAWSDGKLTMTVQGQPTYPLESVGNRRYKLGAPAPDGFFITFRPKKDKPDETEAYLEQPQGNYVLARVKSAMSDAANAESGAANVSPSLKELIGSYEFSQGGGRTVEIKISDGKVALVVPGQPPYPLVEKERDVYALSPLPDSYRLLVKRDDKGAVAAIVSKQPEGEFAFKRTAEFKSPLTVDELMLKVIAAAGGEANIRKHRSMLSIADIDFENQGVKGVGRTIARAPNQMDAYITIYALGKELGWLHEYFDGGAGAKETSFTEPEIRTGKALADARIASDFYEPLNWRALFKTIEIKRIQKVGDEDAFVVVKTPETGNPVTDYISTKTFLLLRRDSIETSGTSSISLPVTETFSDYRSVDGRMLPFKTVTHTVTMGDIVVTLKEIKYDVDAPAEAFRPRAALKK